MVSEPVCQLVQAKQLLRPAVQKVENVCLPESVTNVRYSCWRLHHEAAS
jgi:hypothetical protein